MVKKDNSVESGQDFDFAKAAKEFAKENKDYGHESIIVVSDGSVFYGTLKGKNSCDNHVATNPDLSFKEITIKEKED